MTARSTQPGEELHRHVIEELALQLGCDDTLVAAVYWDELQGLRRQARLHDFLPAFAARRTRDRIRRIHRRDH
jgi:hypothetical protein